MTSSPAARHGDIRFMHRIIAVTTALIVAAFGVVGILVYDGVGRMLSERIDAEISLAGQSAADGVQKWLRGRQALIENLAANIAALPAGDVRALISRTTLTEAFQPIYYGEQDGSFTRQPSIKMAEDYDPRKRPWYQAAQGADTVIMTKPYISASTKQLVMTIAAPVRRDGALGGVAGADLDLETMKGFLRSFDLGGRGYVFLVDAENVVLVHPDPQKIMKKLEDTPAADRDGSEMVRFYPISDLPSIQWRIGVAVDRAVIMQPLHRLAMMLSLAILGIVAVIVPLLGMVLNRQVARPITALTEAMMALGRGVTDITVSGTERRDEIGAIARSVLVFRDSLLDSIRLTTAGHAEQAEKERRSKEIERLTRDFDQAASSAIDTVADAALHMRDQAGTLSAATERTTHKAGEVTTVARQASGNVESVASATDKLRASIDRIADQVAQASRVSDTAVTQADHTRDIVAGLEQAAHRISEVIGLINHIAGQTNLLALNATIEAARAGEAGKGFAVVAGEVKSLANQTSKATEDISRQIIAVQDATEQAVAAISGIGVTIGEIHSISAAITAAVEDQGCATQEIIHNVEQAATGTGIVTDHIQDVRESATDAGQAAQSVLSASSDLAGQTEAMRALIGDFLSRMRTT